MPRSIRSVGLFCVSVLGSVAPLVGYQRAAWADAAPAASGAQSGSGTQSSSGAQSSPTSPHTAKSATSQSPTVKQPAAAAPAAPQAPVAVTPAASTPAAPAPAAPAAAKPPVTATAGASFKRPAFGETTPPAPTVVPPTAPATAPATSPTTPAPTPEALAAAQAALATGQAAYASGDYVLAEAQFRAALAQAPSAAAEYGLAMTLDLEAKPAEACAAFQALFAMPDFATLPPDQASAAQQRHQVLQAIPAQVVIIVSANAAQLEVDGAPQTGQSPFSLRLAAGKHHVRATAVDYEPAEADFEVGPAEQRELSLAPKALPKPVAPPVEAPLAEPLPAPPPPSKMPAYITIGVAGAAAITGAIFGIQALSAKSAFDKEPTVGHADDVERNALIADMAFGVAFTLGITGVVLLTTDEPSDPSADKTALELMPYVSRTSGGAAARLTF